MNQREFIGRYRAFWDEYERSVDTASRRKHVGTEQREAVAKFPHQFRQLSHQLALARDRNYSPALVQRLNALALRGHHLLHRPPGVSAHRVARFLGHEFPAQVRRDAAAFWFATACLYLPAFAMLAAAAYDSALLYAVLDPAQASVYEEMYNPASSHYAKERASDSDFLMFGFYIRNNIGIGFQTFASGLLFGIGSVFYLVFNGLFLGATTAHLLTAGFGDTFFAFVVTHGAFELTAIVLAGTAGLKLGNALLAPGRRTRRDALTRAAGESAVLVTGLTGMLVIAAFLEAFWSSSTLIPVGAKFGVGAFCWLLVAVYFTRSGAARGTL